MCHWRNHGSARFLQLSEENLLLWTGEPLAQFTCYRLKDEVVYPEAPIGL